jgi:drug/metabolite transporter (DMT)-like permease
MPHRRIRIKAVNLLVLATLFWGFSFPLMKSLLMLQARLVPDGSTWFFSALCLTTRFGAAALVLMLWHWRTLGCLGRLEVWQGVGLGLFGSGGLLLQMDALAYMSASASAFLTQFYCLIIPIVVALQLRRWPSPIVLAGCALVLCGVAILSQLNWHELSLGRGEAETLLGSFIFSGQIMWLERPLFSANRIGQVTWIMFAVIAVACLPVAILTTPAPAAWLVTLRSPVILALLAILIVFCTLIAYLLMNYWQPCVTATEAGLIYCAEPVFTSVYTLFLPAWFSTMAGIDYPNERPTLHLLIGGVLILTANVLIQTHPLKPVNRVGSPDVPHAERPLPEKR